MKNEKDVRKAQSIINAEFNSQEELNIEAKSNLRTNYVITEAATQMPQGAKKFFRIDKFQAIFVGLLYAIFFFLILFSYSFSLDNNLSPQQKFELPLNHLVIMLVFIILFAIIGFFPIFLLKMNRSTGIDTKTMFFHIANIVPLFIFPIYNIIDPLTDNKNVINNHTLIGAIVILVQGICLGFAMIFTNLANRKRYPILAKKTIAFWSAYILQFIAPLLFWSCTTSFNLLDSYNTTSKLIIFLVVTLLWLSFMLLLALYLSSRYYIIRDRLTFKLQDVPFFLIVCVLIGLLIGTAACFIDYKTIFIFSNNIYIIVCVAIIFFIINLVFAIHNWTRVNIKKSTPITNSFLINSLMMVQILTITILMLFLSRDDHGRMLYPYYAIIMGVDLLLIIIVNHFFEVNIFLLNFKGKIVIYIIAALLFLFTAIIMSTLSNGAVLKQVYSLELSLLEFILISCVFAINAFYDFALIVLAKWGKLVSNEQEKKEQVTMANTQAKKEINP